MSLFDPDEVDPRQHAARLSTGARRTLRLRAMLDRGVHPVTRGPTKDGTTCGTCAHLTAHRHAKTYFKCGLVPSTGGPATDIRVSWPGCEKHERAHG